MSPIAPFKFWDQTSDIMTSVCIFEVNLVITLRIAGVCCQVFGNRCDSYCLLDEIFILKGQIHHSRPFLVQLQLV